MSLGAHAPIGEKKYTPLTTEHMGEGRDTTGGERQAPQVDGPSPQPALETRFQVFLKKKKIVQSERRGGAEGWVLSRLYTTL